MRLEHLLSGAPGIACGISALFLFPPHVKAIKKEGRRRRRAASPRFGVIESHSSVGQSATLIMWRSAVQVCLGLRMYRHLGRARVFRGGLAQLARAPALQAGGQRFESVILHIPFPRKGKMYNDILGQNASKGEIRRHTRVCQAVLNTTRARK